jgi:lipopolysaccharide export system protein LptA
MRPLARAMLAALVALPVAGTAMHAQAAAPRAEKPCIILMTGVESGPRITRMRSEIIDSAGLRNTYVGGAVDATCEGQGNRLLADSAEHFAAQGLLILYNNVRYTEERVTMTSNRMVYYTREERLVAEGNVRGRTASGTRFEGPRMEYFRASPGLRTENSWIATGRPFVRMSPTETGAEPGSMADSTDLTANTVRSRNDSLLFASGGVVLERPDMRATADSAFVDNGEEYVRFLRNPRIVGLGERPFTLVGTEIDAWSQARKLERVLALEDAVATSDSLTLRSDTIDIRFTEQEIARIYAWGRRARADASTQVIEADSLDVEMPGQELRTLYALGSALAHAAPDSARIVSEERDWISGDTLVVHFEQVADTAGATRTALREVIATVEARAYYQLPPPGGERGVPSLSYNRGRQITVTFDNGEMAGVRVSEQASGLYLEPVIVAPTDTTRQPSTRRRP